MEKFGKSQPVKRTEDHRFLTGQGRYMDDAVPDNALYAAFFRSTVAHARIIALDLDAARQLQTRITVAPVSGPQTPPFPVNPSDPPQAENMLRCLKNK